MNDWGIYAILCNPTGKRYVGQALCVGGRRARWMQHQQYLRGGNHGNRHLQAAWNKYGSAAFVLIRLADCRTRAGADRAEIRFIKKFRAEDNAFGFNKAPGGSNSPSLNPETLAKMRATWRDSVFRKKRRALLVVTHNRPETRKRLSEALRKGYSGAVGKRRRAKLRRSLIETYKDPAVREHNAALRRKEWARDPARKRRHVAMLKAYHLRKKLNPST